jgi:hypothetical protein
MRIRKLERAVAAESRVEVACRSLNRNIESKNQND